MTTRGLTYALVTPARDERDNLPRLAASVLGQTVRPQSWVVVDDHSRDGSLELVQGAGRRAPARARPRLGRPGRRRPLRGPARGPRPARLPARHRVPRRARRRGRQGRRRHLVRPRLLRAPARALRHRRPPRHRRRRLLELEDGAWVRRSTTATHPRGASRAYRWACVEDLMALEPRMGWDGLDEVKVALRGFRTRQFADLALPPPPGRGRPRAPPPPRAAPCPAARPGTWATARATSSCGRCTAPGPTPPRWRWSGATRPRRSAGRRAAPTRAVVAAVQERQALTSLLRHGLPART